VIAKHPIHGPVEQMTLRTELLGRDEQALLLALALSHGHARILHTYDRVDLDQAFRSGLE
jgi:hypothetical protein